MLCGILLPSLRAAREQSRRCACQASMSQMASAFVAYGNTRNGELPGSVSVGPTAAVNHGEELMAARLQRGAEANDGWDGLGLLVKGGYLDEHGKCLYCASHHGEHPSERYGSEFAATGARQIYGNYQYSSNVQYAAKDQNQNARITIDSGRSVLLLTDGLRTRGDFNHVSGMNRMFADLSIEWWADTAQSLLQKLPEGETPASDFKFDQIWLAAGSANALP